MCFTAFDNGITHFDLANNYGPAYGSAERNFGKLFREELHPYAEQCKKTDKNRTVRINRELTAMHQEVIENLESIQGALLRMNRYIQSEGTFGIMKNNRWYKRIVRRGIKSVLLEVFLVSIGHNLYKYHNKQKKGATAA